MDHATSSTRFKVTVDLFETGKAMMRQKLRRRYPGESEDRIEQRLRLWVIRRDPYVAEPREADGS